MEVLKLLGASKQTLQRAKEVLIIVMSKDYHGGSDPVNEKDIRCKLEKMFAEWNIETINYSVID